MHARSRHPQRRRRAWPAGRILRLWSALGIPADYALSRGLALQREPARLVGIGLSPSGKPVRLSPRAAAAWRRLKAAAAAEGLALVPISGFRSIGRQTALVRAKLDQGESLAHILRFVAAPGCSEHHTGRALDLGCPGCIELTGRFGRSRAFRWLKRHAPRFGFHLSYPKGNPHRIGYEPWHWCWSPQR